MRVLFLTLYPDTVASARYRVGQYVPYLRQQGIDCTVVHAVPPRQHARLTGPNRRVRAGWYHVVETPRRLVQLLSARRYDIAFVQKAILTAYLRGADTLLRRSANHIVYDIDDAVHLRPPHPLRSIWKIFEDGDQISKLFSMADLVLAGNSWLAKVAQDSGARAEILPTVVDTDRFEPAATSNGAYRIGWIGNPSTTECLEPALEALRGAEDADVTLVGADASRLHNLSADLRPWGLESEVEDIQAFSVGIMPLPKTEWTRGKCALKALQYMACGVPCIATPHGAVTDIIKDGENGLLADNTGEWRAAIDRLRDPSERKRLGDAGRETVVQHFSLLHARPRFAQLLESVL